MGLLELHCRDLQLAVDDAGQSGVGRIRLKTAFAALVPSAEERCCRNRFGGAFRAIGEHHHRGADAAQRQGLAVELDLLRGLDEQPARILAGRLGGVSVGSAQAGLASRPAVRTAAPVDFMSIMVSLPRTWSGGGYCEDSAASPATGRRKMRCDISLATAAVRIDAIGAAVNKQRTRASRCRWRAFENARLKGQGCAVETRLFKPHRGSLQLAIDDAGQAALGGSAIKPFLPLMPQSLINAAVGIASAERAGRSVNITTDGLMSLSVKVLPSKRTARPASSVLPRHRAPEGRPSVGRAMGGGGAVE
jgi:hypothetical protein